MNLNDYEVVGYLPNENGRFCVSLEGNKAVELREDDEVVVLRKKDKKNATRKCFRCDHTHYWADVVKWTQDFLGTLRPEQVISVIEHENMISVWYWE